VIIKAGNEYNLRTNSSNISAQPGSWYRHYPGPYLCTRISEYLRNCPCLCPQVEGEGITSYILSFCLNMKSHPPLVMDNIQRRKKFRHELLAYFGPFCYVWHTHDIGDTAS